MPGWGTRARKLGSCPLTASECLEHVHTEDGNQSVGRAGRRLALSKKVTAKEVAKHKVHRRLGWGRHTGSRLAPLDFFA